VQKFTSEGDFETLEGWLRCQFDIDAATLSPDQLESWCAVLWLGFSSSRGLLF
jgi:hypothetical protein